MEDKKNNRPLPSNYVTLVQLQERWLKQQQSKIIQQQQQQPPNQDHRHDQKVIDPIDGNTSSSQPHKQYVVKNRTDSESRFRAAEEDKRKLEIGAGGIGDETDDLSGKVSESKKKKKNNNRKWKLKRMTEKRGASGEGSGTAAQGSDEGKKKATIENDLNEAEQKSARVSPVEQRVRVLTIKPVNGKQNGRFGKMSNGFRHYRSQRKKHYGEAHGIEEAEKKATIENEENNGCSVTAEEVVNRSVRVLTINSGNLGKTSNDFGNSQSQRKHYVEAQRNEDAEKIATIDNHQLKEEEEEKKKNTVGSVTLEEAEKRVRVLSINSGHVEQNKMKNGFRHSQPWKRKYYRGEASHDYGYGYGNLQHYSKVREKKMVWVKKDEFVG